MPEQSFAAILLAAGASTRLGQPKQLLQMEGETLLRRTARLALEAGCAPVLVVLGYEADRMKLELNGLEAVPVENAAWSEGMGSSLRAGMTALLQSGGTSAGVLLLVCDQPRLTVETLKALLNQHSLSAGLVTASVYAGKAGVPAVFSPRLFPELARAAGDRGARDLIRGQGEALQTVSWPDGALDVDDPADLAGLRAQ